MKKSSSVFYVFILGLFMIAIGTTSCDKSSDDDSEPTISSITPSSVTTGDEITITGTGLSGATVTIDNVIQTVTSNSSTALKMRVLGGSIQLGSAGVVVTNSVGSATSSLNITDYGISITSITPAKVKIGDQITITGKGLSNASVRVYLINAPVSNNTDNSLNVTIPTSGIPNNVDAVAVEVSNELGIVVKSVPVDLD